MKGDRFALILAALLFIADAPIAGGVFLLLYAISLKRTEP